jgi:myo-inositol-1(or 4)-monophosphatase
MINLATQASAFAVELALEALGLIREGMRVPRETVHKAPGDFASALDASIESMLKIRIFTRYPNHLFLGEEGGGNRNVEVDQPVWIVDPIDGSVNFVRGYPQYCISIALVLNGEPIAACVADPCRGEVFSAAAGQGSFLNGQRIVVAQTATFAHAIAATVFPKPDALFMESYMARLNRVIRNVAGVRRAGSMALELAYLAAGRVDVFWERGMGPWDAAAGVLLIREAGGEVFTLDGRPWIDSAEICAAITPLALSWHQLLTVGLTPSKRH